MFDTSATVSSVVIEWGRRRPQRSNDRLGPRFSKVFQKPSGACFYKLDPLTRRFYWRTSSLDRRDFIFLQLVFSSPARTNLLLSTLNVFPKPFSGKYDKAFEQEREMKFRWGTFTLYWCWPACFSLGLLDCGTSVLRYRRWLHKMNFFILEKRLNRRTSCRPPYRSLKHLPI